MGGPGACVPESQPLANLEQPITHPTAPVNPREVLARIAFPQNMGEWNNVQDEVWRGHPTLPESWVRCWSRSRDMEYYVNVVTMATTFNINDLYVNWDTGWR